MTGVNKVILVGNVGKDVEIRRTQAGDPIANFTLATSDRWTNKTTGAKEERTEWHRIVVFGGLAKVVEQYVQKGMRLYLQGKLVTRKWQDQSGADRWTTEVQVQPFGGELVMLSGGPGREGGQSSNNAEGGDREDDPLRSSEPMKSYELDDDIPF